MEVSTNRQKQNTQDRKQGKNRTKRNDIINQKPCKWNVSNNQQMQGKEKKFFVF
ncbi:hypothetical protein D0Y65_035494 [Glycine soja]|uniref:Uncharacterized protein n=1 Tax=Glycine soja TaxID=3848 RepID=A0A445HAL7_GLYSO|nr:hypothetical protein D0Y65_035494 [Glycine soja]